MSRPEHASLTDLPPWILRCPRGHTTWEPIDGHFVCRACSRRGTDGNGRFDLVENVRSGEQLDREEIARLEEAACRETPGD